MATETDKIDTGALGTLVAVGTAAMIGISLAVNALVRSETDDLQAARETGGAAYQKLEQSQREKLSAPPAWTDDTKSRVSLPIDRAMDLVLSDLKKSPWSASPGVPTADAGADAATDSADAGAPDAESADSGAEAGAEEAVPEPPAPPPPRPESPAPMGPPGTPRPPEPSKVPSAGAPVAPAPKPSAAPAAPAPKPTATPAAPLPKPTAPTAPAPVAPSAPPATP